MPAVRVKSVRVRRLIVPLPRPLDARVGRFAHGPFLALDLETDAGTTGRVRGFTFARLGLTVVPPVIAALAEFAMGRPLTLDEMPRFHDACQEHLSRDFSVHVLAVTPTRHWLEYMDRGQAVLAGPVVPHGGHMTPRDAPGTGVEWNEATIGQYLVESQEAA